MVGIGVDRFEDELYPHQEEGDLANADLNTIRSCGIPNVDPKCGRGPETGCSVYYTGYLRQCTDDEIRSVAVWLLERRQSGKHMAKKESS